MGSSVACIHVSLLQMLRGGMFLREGWLFLSWSLVLWSPVPVCFHLLHLDGAEDKEKCSASTRAEQTPWGNGRRLRFYVSAEDSVEQVASGAVGGVTVLQVWGTRAITAKDVQLLETSCVYDLQKRRRKGPGSPQKVGGVNGSTSFCQVMETLPVLNSA